MRMSQRHVGRDISRLFLVKDPSPLSTAMVILFEPLTMLTTCDAGRTAFGSPRYRIQKRSLEQLTSSQDTILCLYRSRPKTEKTGYERVQSPLGSLAL